MSSAEKPIVPANATEIQSSFSEAPADPSAYLIVALDLPSAAEAMRLTEKLGNRCKWLKVGMELFYAEGGSFVRELRARGFRIFLDLKLYDIPNTVSSAIRALEDLGADLLTIHASGGPEMLRAASSAARPRSEAPLLAAVTVLTSMDELQLQAVGMTDATGAQVMRLARLSLECGLGALVSSPWEVGALREEFGPQPILIVPGIRPNGFAAHDQVRTATPQKAIKDGASLLVVGRPISRSDDPLQTVNTILEEISEGLEDRRKPPLK